MGKRTKTKRNQANLRHVTILHKRHKKLHHYQMRKKSRKSKNPLNIFLKNVILNISIFSFAVLLYMLIVDLMARHAGYFLFFQLATAKIVYYMQYPFFDVALSGTRLLYKNLAINVTFDCIGLRQSLFFLMLVFSFMQVDIRRRSYAFVFIPLIIAMNILRISALYPLSLALGIEKAAAFHEFMYSYGNGIFIFILLIAWFYVFVYKMQKRQREAL